MTTFVALRSTLCDDRSLFFWSHPSLRALHRQANCGRLRRPLKRVFSTRLAATLQQTASKFSERMFLQVSSDLHCTGSRAVRCTAVLIP